MTDLKVVVGKWVVKFTDKSQGAYVFTNKGEVKITPPNLHNWEYEPGSLQIRYSPNDNGFCITNLDDENTYEILRLLDNGKTKIEHYQNNTKIKMGIGMKVTKELLVKTKEKKRLSLLSNQNGLNTPNSKKRFSSMYQITENPYENVSMDRSNPMMLLIGKWDVVFTNGIKCRYAFFQDGTVVTAPPNIHGWKGTIRCEYDYDAEQYGIECKEVPHIYETISMVENSTNISIQHKNEKTNEEIEGLAGRSKNDQLNQFRLFLQFSTKNNGNEQNTNQNDQDETKEQENNQDQDINQQNTNNNKNNKNNNNNGNLENLLKKYNLGNCIQFIDPNNRNELENWKKEDLINGMKNMMNLLCNTSLS